MLFIFNSIFLPQNLFQIFKESYIKKCYNETCQTMIDFCVHYTMNTPSNLTNIHSMHCIIVELNA